MSDLTQKIQEELQLAFEVKDKQALNRAARAIAEATVDRSTYNAGINGVRAEISLLAERMEQGFRRMDQRFE